jgi:hypothetical protein
MIKQVQQDCTLPFLVSYKDFTFNFQVESKGGVSPQQQETQVS